MAEIICDYTDETEESMDAGRPPAGFYLAELAQVKPAEKDGKLGFFFSVLLGAFKGAMYTEFLLPPDNCTSEQALQMSKKKFNTWAIRLGLVQKNAAGKSVGVNFDKAVGVKVVLHLVDRTYLDKQTGLQKTICALAWAPFNLDHIEIPIPVRIELGLPLLPGQNLPDPNAPPPPPAGVAGKVKSPPKQPKPVPAAAVDPLDDFN